MSNYKKVKSEIDAYKEGITLVAVSKTHTIEDVKDAYNEGARIFGENRVQEIEEKFSVPFENDYKVFMIGRLQMNKVKKAVKYSDRIESVDSLALILKIEKEAALLDKTIDILLEVNSSFEAQKGGFESVEDTLIAYRKCKEMPHIHLLGLMTVGPLGGDEEKNREAFKYTKHIYDMINKEYPLSVLSMGMSGDWQQALDEGSTEVRIGTSIFGARVY